MLSLSVPEGWKAECRAKKMPDGTEKGFILGFEPTNNPVAGCLINFSYITNEEPNKATLQKDLLRMAEGIVPKSVEKKATVKEFSLEKGYGAYCLFTDASLVGKPVPKGEFRVMGVGLIQPSTDALGVVSMMTDDATTKEFKMLLKVIDTVKLIRERPKLLLDSPKK